MGPGDLLGLGLRRGIERFPRGMGGDSRITIEVGSMNLVEVILGIEVLMWVWRYVMLVGSSRGWKGPRFLTAIISDSSILQQGKVVVILHGGSQSGGGEANELLHGLNHPKFRDVVDSSLEEGQPSGIGEGLLSWRYFIQLSELLIEVEDKLLSGTPPRFIQDSCGDIGV